MTRADLVGWTLAELAFVLLFAVLAAVVPSYKRALSHNKELKAENAKYLHLVKENHDLQEQNDLLASTLREDRKHLRSTVLPSCAELDSNGNYLFSATITSANSYEIEGHTYSLAELLARFAQPISFAKKRGCVERIKLYFQSGVAVEEYNEAMRRIDETFYATPLGVR